MEKKQYIAPAIKLCLIKSEGIMYSTSVEIGEDLAKKNNGFFSDFDDLENDAPEPAYPQAKSLWSADESYDAW